MNHLYDLIIIGGGPGGAAAAVYSGRKKLDTLVITESFGGQSFNSGDIENWIGTLHLSGFELAQKLEEHVKAQEDVTVQQGELVTSVRQSSSEDYSFTNPIWEVETNKATYHTKGLVVTSGGRRKKLEVPGEDEFAGRGVVYCSTCDAPLFRDKDVVVVGSGNAAMEGVIDALPYAKKIFMLIRGDHMKGDDATKEKILEHEGEKITIIYHGESKQVLGETVVTGLEYLDKQTSETKTLEVQGIFVEIGSLPNSEFMKGVVDLNERDQIIIDHRSGKTSASGIFAAGAVVDQLYDQNNISVGDAIKATLTAYNYVVHFK
ncbi:FAD-dependent oxidoreductase [candidate division WWE3 bacterium]|uniref:FAD-dependent oxidoreductase n=1 Tax=candidate division WWE3 bacterium TaxID=2053526 RepID=A0A955LGJ8_UNCKA|nr:FAD-dependent oxidoreductase [candidate division WWE3 bacterium]